MGPEHRDVAATMTNLANAYADLGRIDDARRMHEDALEIKHEVLGPDHPDVGYSLSGLADLDRQTRRYARARTRYEQALAVWERGAGHEHPAIANVLAILAEVALEQGDADDAVAYAQRLLDRMSNSRDADHVAAARFVLAQALWHHPHRRTEAIDHAIAARDAWRGSEQPDKRVADVERWLAQKR
jgi:tetratricopeptide (TPR) repeat protein